MLNFCKLYCSIVHTGNKARGIFHVLKVLQRSGEVKFFDVKAHVPCILCAYHAVPVEFHSVEVSCANGGIAIIIDQIASRCDSDVVGIILLQSVIHNQIGICEKILGCKSMPDFLVCHDKHCVRSFLASFVATLHHASKIFSKCSLPHLGCGQVVH
jgi:hypothetical protein